jgi:hypothetical protein
MKGNYYAEVLGELEKRKTQRKIQKWNFAFA